RTHRDPRTGNVNDNERGRHLNGISLQFLGHSPPGCPGRTVRRRLREWRAAGVFEAWAASLRDEYLPAHGPCFMDATFIRARTKADDIGLTRTGKAANCRRFSIGAPCQSRGTFNQRARAKPESQRTGCPS